ncbi:hypothetical protein RJ40_02355 [Methanofollis aquaemaris]|uniref:Uncharacterized protein n=1 Tax=Methanofollis aquaemaris TaxID=126734 RepID=A0A8A3S3G3_9EURY|nr:hypothetical protein [Methanofollis aquaemaris]QSZ66419.1 hypothetical protein RJ40_02355 [Methanofollis aquaemaris]
MKALPLLVIFGVAFACLVAPGSAIVLNNLGVAGSQTIEVSGSDLDIDVIEVASGSAIIEAYVYDVSPGTTVSVTLSRPNGDIWTGSYSHSVLGIMGTTGNVTYTLGSSSSSHEYLRIFPADSMFWIGYASDPDAETSGVALADLPSDPSEACYVQIPYINHLPITRIHLSTGSSDEIRAVVHYSSASAVSDHIDQGSDTTSAMDWLSQLLSFAGEVWSVIWVVISVFKFIFLDHFLAVLALYESVLIAYAASHSRDIIAFSRKMVRYNERLFTIFFKFIFGIVTLFYNIIRALKPI